MENKSPNLPPHLQEKLDDKAEEFEYKTNVGRDCYNCNGYSIGLTEGFKAGYQQAYSDLMKELGPVVEALESVLKLNPRQDDYGDFYEPAHVIPVKAKALGSIKHLKERILPEERTVG